VNENSDASFVEVEKCVRETLTPEAVTRLPAVDVVQHLSAARAIAHPKELFKDIPAQGEVVRLGYVGDTVTIKRINCQMPRLPIASPVLARPVLKKSSSVWPNSHSFPAQSGGMRR